MFPRLPPSAPPIAVVLTDEDPAEILFQVMGFRREHGRFQPFPTILSTEPGPLVFANGLRILPNQVMPRVSPSFLLVISANSATRAGPVLEALVRRTHQEGGRVMIVGDRFPDSVSEWTLLPGQRLTLVPIAELAQGIERGFWAWAGPDGAAAWLPGKTEVRPESGAQ